MKKFLILIILSFLINGCVNKIQNKQINNIENKGVQKDLDVKNKTNDTKDCSFYENEYTNAEENMPLALQATSGFNFKKWCEQCLEGGGFPSFTHEGLICNKKTSDQGRKCNDKRDCEGWCVQNFNTKRGECSDTTELSSGCGNILNDGKIVTMCFE